MKLRNTVIVVAAVAMAATIQTAQAAFTDTLADLTSANGTYNSLTIGDKTFSGFSALVTGGATVASGLTVTAEDVNGIYYLDFSGGIGVNNTAGNVPSGIGDVILKYTVSASAGLISMIDQNYTPNALAVAGNQIIIGETVKDTGGNVLANSTLSLTPAVLSEPPPAYGETLTVTPPQDLLYVVKDIQITAAVGQVVGLSDVEQSFHQVPEPTTVLAGALLLLPLGASTLRILRRNRMS